mmetsp:Transcript_77892/g.252536  ORF Transcript_77892/g.252536 Transcript_77892/m.252536 type:complete len:299 (-) Transcript_77892:393-1289(-)
MMRMAAATSPKPIVLEEAIAPRPMMAEPLPGPEQVAPPLGTTWPYPRCSHRSPESAPRTRSPTVDGTVDVRHAAKIRSARWVQKVPTKRGQRSSTRRARAGSPFGSIAALSLEVSMPAVRPRTRQSCCCFRGGLRMVWLSQARSRYASRRGHIWRSPAAVAQQPPWVPAVVCLLSGAPRVRGAWAPRRSSTSARWPSPPGPAWAPVARVARLRRAGVWSLCSEAETGGRGWTRLRSWTSSNGPSARVRAWLAAEAFARPLRSEMAVAGCWCWAGRMGAGPCRRRRFSSWRVCSSLLGR